MLHELKEDKFARIVEINKYQNLKEKLSQKGIAEGDILRIISCYGPISFEIEGRTFIIGKGLAEKIRVIEINSN
jgi:Fe2+ transport system protein FeoA